MKKLLKLLRFALFAPAILLFSAEGDQGASGGSGDPNAGDKGGEGDKGNKDSNAGDKGGGSGSGGKDPEKLTMTQADLDAIIERRLARDRKDREKAAEEEKKKAAMTESELLKAEKAEADKKAADIQSAANTRIARSEFKIAAQAAGVPADRLEAAVRLADLSELTPDEKTGEFSKKDIDNAVKATIKANPFLTAGANGGGSVGGGANPGGGSGTSGGMNAFIRKAAGR